MGGIGVISSFDQAGAFFVPIAFDQVKTMMGSFSADILLIAVLAFVSSTAALFDVSCQQQAPKSSV